MGLSIARRALVTGVLGGVARFTGPYDGVTFAAAYSVRRLFTAYTGDCLLLRRSTDDVELAFGFTSAGVLDTAAITAWLAGGTGYVKTWYDQSGNGRNVTQTTTTAQPTLELNQINGKPTLSSPGILKSASVTLFPSNEATAFWVFRYASSRIMTKGPLNNFVLNAGGSNRIFITQAAETIQAPSDSFPVNVPLIFTGIWSATNGYMYRDGVQKASGAWTGAPSDDAGILALFGNEEQTLGMTGKTAEVLFLDGVATDAAANTIGSSQGAYYGLSWTNFT